MTKLLSSIAIFVSANYLQYTYYDIDKEEIYVSHFFLPKNRTMLLFSIFGVTAVYFNSLESTIS
jgi:hypothetical protein